MQGGALVTGAGRGLGAEIARRLAARGLAVHVTDVDGAAAEATAAGLGGGAWASVLDVADAGACRAAARATADRAGSLAVWVNNAGVLRTGYAWDHTDAERDLMLRANTTGLMNGTLAALELMRPADRGHVVNIVSLAGIVAAPGEAVYAASKHAAMAFTLGTLFDLRRAGTKGVWVSAVCPDGIWTPMLHDKLEDPDAAVSFSGQLLQPEDVAAAAVGLLDRPRPVLIMPRWRGPVLRAFDALPGLGLRLLPLVLADARRRQRGYARKLRGART
jgi:NAD(P)-dependent dehydrogenase (short-subunit alcohol dehydrogenase family)